VPNMVLKASSTDEGRRLAGVRPCRDGYRPLTYAAQAGPAFLKWPERGVAGTNGLVWPKAS